MDKDKIIENYQFYNELKKLVDSGALDLVIKFIKKEYYYDSGEYVKGLSYGELVDKVYDLVAVRAKEDILDEICDTMRGIIIDKYNEYLELYKKVVVLDNKK